jgi:uncharacterized protein
MRIALLSLALTVIPVMKASDSKVLVYTRNHVTNGKGYVHDNIATSVEAIRALGAEHGFGVDATDDPQVFTPEKLKQYKVIVFSSSNNEAFENDSQRDAFRGFLRRGGGLVGIHSATGSERAWPYFWSVMGGKFIRHPKLQKFTVKVHDTKHPITAGLPATFKWEDECYLFSNMNPDVKVLLSADPSELEDPKKDSEPGQMRDGRYPLAWYHTIDGARVFYTGLGHKKEHYTEPLLRGQIANGILWVMRQESNRRTD